MESVVVTGTGSKRMSPKQGIIEIKRINTNGEEKSQRKEKRLGEETGKSTQKKKVKKDWRRRNMHVECTSA